MKTFVKFPPRSGNHGVFAVNCEVVHWWYVLPYLCTCKERSQALSLSPTQRCDVVHTFSDEATEAEKLSDLVGYLHLVMEPGVGL